MRITPVIDDLQSFFVLRHPRPTNFRSQQLACRYVYSLPIILGSLPIHFGETYKQSDLKHKLLPIDDYIIKPRSSGYRGVHLIYSYFSDKNETYNGLKVELQFRSPLQHAWATPGWRLSLEIRHKGSIIDAAVQEKDISTQTGEPISRLPRLRRTVDGFVCRELEIFSFIGSGVSVSELACELHVSVKTIETHQMRMKEKLALHTAAELRQKAREWLAQSAVNRIREDPEAA
jgi:DNA-binding CsgD family transcriptional regulator